MICALLETLLTTTYENRCKICYDFLRDDFRLCAEGSLRGPAFLFDAGLGLVACD